MQLSVKERRRRAKVARRKFAGLPRLDHQFGRGAYVNWRYGWVQVQPIPRPGLVRMYLTTALVRFSQMHHAQSKAEQLHFRNKAEHSAGMAVQILTGRPS